VPYGGVGHRAPRLADLCARLATWLHVDQLRRETGRAPRPARSGVAPHQIRRRAEWVRGGGGLATKTEHHTQNTKLELAVRHFYLADSST
jgi:hypothetical protein